MKVSPLIPISGTIALLFFVLAFLRGCKAVFSGREQVGSGGGHRDRLTLTLVTIPVALFLLGFLSGFHSPGVHRSSSLACLIVSLFNLAYFWKRGMASLLFPYLGGSLALLVTILSAFRIF